MKAYKHLVKHALASGHTVSVWDGEEWQVEHCDKFQKIIDAIESVGESQIRTTKDGFCTGWALIIPSLADDETVADCTETPFMLEWAFDLA